MKAIVVNNIVKFLVQDADTITTQSGKLKINFADGNPSLFVPSITSASITTVEGVTAEDLPDFTGDKYQYIDGNFSLIGA